MDQSEVQRTVQTCKKTENLEPTTTFVSLETEIPETLYTGLKQFIGENPHLDQYVVMSSALANFLYQNGCSDRAVTERYLSDLFTRSDS